MQYTKTLLGACLLLLCLTLSQATGTTVVSTNYTIVNTYNRTGNINLYYTEGLAFYNSTTLIESAGIYGKSSIHYVSFPDMNVTTNTNLSSTYFAEGTTSLEVNGVEYIYQMTWKEMKVFVYKASDLSLYKTLVFPSTIAQGWGLTKGTYVYNGKTMTVFYISNGSSNIYIVDPSTFTVLKTVAVKKLNGAAITQLNELEMVNGMIWANIYMTTQVAIIDPASGYVSTIVDFSKLQTLAKTQASSMGLTIGSGDVLNGIAYDTTNNVLVVTGKRWPLMWQIKVNGV